MFAAILSLSAPVIAQDREAVSEELNATRTFLLKFRVTTLYRDSMTKSVLAYENKLAAHCKDVALDFDSPDVRDRILAPLERGPDGVPVAGGWRESVPGTACNQKHTYNVLVHVMRDGPSFTCTFPGDAAGDPELQIDTLKSIEKNFQTFKISQKKSCHLEVIDTRLIGEQSVLLDSGLLSPWEEAWDIQACGKCSMGLDLGNPHGDRCSTAIRSVSYRYGIYHLLRKFPRHNSGVPSFS